MCSDRCLVYMLNMIRGNEIVWKKCKHLKKQEAKTYFEVVTSFQEIFVWQPGRALAANSVLESCNFITSKLGRGEVKWELESFKCM